MNLSHSLHPALQTIGRQGALTNCILGNHLLIKWLNDNHMIKLIHWLKKFSNRCVSCSPPIFIAYNFVCIMLILWIPSLPRWHLMTKRRTLMPTKKSTFTVSILLHDKQLIQYSRACSSYHDALDRGLLLTRMPLNQGFLLVMLKSSLRTSYGRH
jgi:hypothetical protein